MEVKSANDSGFIDGELTYGVIGCAQRVHRELKPGLPEAVYHRALMHELQKAGISAKAEVSFNVVYDGVVCGDFRVDVLVEDKLILELKAVEQLLKLHEAQLLSYLRASGCRVGLLLNFGETSLRQRRLIL